MRSINAAHNDRRVFALLFAGLAIGLQPGCTTPRIPQPDFFLPARLPFAAVGRPLPTPRAQVVEITRETLGVPYRFGGTSPRTGLDCSGLAKYVYGRMGFDLPTGSRAQFETLHPQKIPQPGDLIFFNINGKVDHVGIYVGDFKFIHAPRTGFTVMYDDMRSSYWYHTFAGIRSVFKPGEGQVVAR